MRGRPPGRPRIIHSRKIGCPHGRAPAQLDRSLTVAADGLFSDRTRKKDVVADAVALATAAVRIAVKNLLIVRALRDHADYEQAWWLGAVAREFEVIAVENETDADRLEKVREATRRKKGRPQHPGDFRATDAPVLRRRIRVLRRIAARLRELATDESALDELIADARRAALDEITAARHTPAPRVTLDPEDREIALTLLAGDLAALAEEHAGGRG